MTQEDRPINEIQMTPGDFFQQIVAQRMMEIKTPRTVLLWLRMRLKWSLENPPMTVFENIRRSRKPKNFDPFNCAKKPRNKGGI